MTEFRLDDFLPYLLNNAAETTGRAFSIRYREDYGMSRAQWRIMAHLGRGLPMTAAEICVSAHLEKSKVSRAVAGLEELGYLSRAPSDRDRRAEMLTLTEEGLAVYTRLAGHAQDFQDTLTDRLGKRNAKLLSQLLRDLARSRQV